MLVKCVVEPRTKVYLILIYILTKLFPVVALVPRQLWSFAFGIVFLVHGMQLLSSGSNILKNQELGVVTPRFWAFKSLLTIKIVNFCIKTLNFSRL